MNADLKAISDKLDDLKGIVTNHITATNIYREDQVSKLAEHEKILTGDSGLKIKVDRLERAEGVRNWIVGTVFTITITALLNYFFHFL
jgi:hypothetical protein